MNYKQLPKKPLGFFPTPVVELHRLSERCDGPRILMKRDDQTGLGMGGNKTRKLEYLVADALAQDSDVLVTAGALQSNHCRQTAAAAAAYGLGCHLVLGGAAPAASTGNYLLDQLFGAHVHWAGEYRKGETIPEVVKQLTRLGHTPYVIPYGGSNEVGAAAFVEALMEVAQQLAAMSLNVSHLVFASSSGGTHAGLTLGKALLGAGFQVIGIEIDKGEAGDGAFEERVVDLTNATARYLETELHFTNDDIVLQKDYVGDGYGIVGDLERNAIKVTAQSEGILLDPVYTGRAMGALLDLIEQGSFTPDDTILFWHTGGTPSLFAYAAELVGR